MERVCTARHDCSPPRAATFFSTTCSAVNFDGADETSAPKPCEIAKVKTNPMIADFRNIVIAPDCLV
jgi:hypothetical protein